MSKEVKLENALDTHLKPLKVGDDTLPIEVSKDDIRISQSLDVDGDLNAKGDINIQGNSINFENNASINATTTDGRLSILANDIEIFDLAASPRIFMVTSAGFDPHIVLFQGVASIKTLAMTGDDSGTFMIGNGQDNQNPIWTINNDANVTQNGTLKIKETASAATDTTAYGQLWVKNDTPNNLYFTNDAGNDVQITNGASLAGSGGGGSSSTEFRHLINAGFNYSSTAGTRVYVPLNGYIVELAFAGTTEFNTFVAPFDGSLSQVVFRSEEACGSTTVGFHKSSTGVEFPNPTPSASVTVDMTADDTPFKFAFTSGNTFSAGDVIAISFDPTNDANDTT